MVFARAPFLRDARDWENREVHVPGVTTARLSRFDWQPAGRGRMLTTVVTGLAGQNGFSFVLEVPLEADTPSRTRDLDAVLGMVRVDAG